MKQFFFSALALVFTTAAAAQAVLPTSWGFDNVTLPTGWTTTGTAYYTGSGNPAPAIKFDSSDDYLTIYVASNPGALTYDIAGNSFTGGTFTVEESVDGTTWTTLHTFTGTIPGSGTYGSVTDVPQSASRYIRFYYTNKATGNVGVDNVSIAVGAATPEQEINVQYASSSVPTGNDVWFNSPVSTPLTMNFTIENLGTGSALNISNATITGPAAADYTGITFPSTVAAASNGTLSFTFTPSVAGSRDAVLSIMSNDTDEATYTINLNGIGGNYSTEPAAQATNMTLTAPRTFRVMGSFVGASGVDGYVVLIKEGSAITGVPADGTPLMRGDIVGDARVVSSGPSASFVPHNMLAGKTYYFAVYTYNGQDQYINYLTTAPLTGNVTTPATMLGATYYDGISTSSATFVDDLHDVINPHTEKYYSDYGTIMINNFAARDTTDGRKVVTCIYSRLNQIYTEPFDFTTYDFSREHTFCYSWMPSNGDTEAPEYNDYHHLFPTNQTHVNAVRSNYPYGKVVNVLSTYGDDKFGTDANGNKVFEPSDQQKGASARAMMYMTVCYKGTEPSGATNDWSLPEVISVVIPYGQDQAILKQWSMDFPPTAYEMTRNDYIDSMQHNRNPFIDHPEWICYVNFNDLTYNASGCNLGMDELLANAFVVFPNPAKDVLNIHVDGATILSYELVDLAGRVVAKGAVDNEIVTKVNLNGLKAGSYIVKAETKYGTAQKTVVID